MNIHEALEALCFNCEKQLPMSNIINYFNMSYLLWDETLVMHKDGYSLIVDDDNDNGDSGDDGDMIMKTCHSMVSHPSTREKRLTFKSNSCIYIIKLKHLYILFASVHMSIFTF